jgi:hypothetical protein
MQVERKDKSSPVFVARFCDGQVTRMTVHCPDGLDAARGVRLAQWAYRSRMKREPPAITQAKFVSKDDQTLATYDEARLTGFPA